MQKLAWVHNKGASEYTEDFNGKMIKIPAKGKIKMERDQARLFLGKFVTPKKDGFGMALNPKPLMMEPIPEQEALGIADEEELLKTSDKLNKKSPRAVKLKDK